MIVSDGVDVGRIRLVTASDQIEIAGLQVLPMYQNHGIGTAVVRRIIEQAQTAGRSVVLEVETDNPDAQRLYERLDFKPSTTIVNDRRTMTRHPLQP